MALRLHCIEWSWLNSSVTVLSLLFAPSGTGSRMHALRCFLAWHAPAAPRPQAHAPPRTCQAQAPRPTNKRPTRPHIWQVQVAYLGKLAYLPTPARAQGGRGARPRPRPHAAGQGHDQALVGHPNQIYQPQAPRHRLHQRQADRRRAQAVVGLRPHPLPQPGRANREGVVARRSRCLIRSCRRSTLASTA